jgi:hypothetical protein
LTAIFESRGPDLLVLPGRRRPLENETATQHNNMDAVAHSYDGFALSLQEQVAFKIAAKKAQIDEKLSGVPAFWGKITGVERDYVLASHMVSSFGQIRKQFYVYKYVGSAFFSSLF